MGIRGEQLRWATTACALVLAVPPGCVDDPQNPGGAAFVPDDDDGGGGSDGQGSCEAPADDDMQASPRIELGAQVRHVRSGGGVTAACGDGFVALLDGEGVTAEATLSGTCVGLDVLDGGQLVAVTAAGGVTLFDAGLVEAASATVSGTPTAIAAEGSSVFVAAGSAGVEVLSASDLAPVSTLDVADARGVAVSSSGLLVAAGAAGVELRDPSSGEVLRSVATPSDALGIRAAGDEAIVLRGAQGWDWLVDDGDLSLEASLPSEGVVVDAMILNGHAFVVEGHTLTRFVLGDEPQRISSEHRRDHAATSGGWIRSLAPLGDGFALADGDGVAPLLIRGPQDSPDLVVDAPSLQLFGDAGAETEGLFVLRNLGDGGLLIRDISAQGPFSATLDAATVEPSSNCSGQFVLGPGQSTSISLLFAPEDGAPQTGSLRIESNDPDQPVLEIPLEGNPSGPAVGDSAIDFSGLTLEGDSFSLDQHAGKVIFLKLFDFGCSTCSEEFPIIQADVLPDYSSDDLVIVGVNKGHRTAYADAIAQEAQLSFPVVLDLDSQAFRHYRIPNQVFPLHIVIDRDGQIALATTEPGLAPVQAVLDTLLP